MNKLNIWRIQISYKRPLFRNIFANLSLIIFMRCDVIQLKLWLHSKARIKTTVLLNYGWHYYDVMYLIKDSVSYNNIVQYSWNWSVFGKGNWESCSSPFSPRINLINSTKCAMNNPRCFINNFCIHLSHIYCPFFNPPRGYIMAILQVSLFPIPYTQGAS